MKFNYLILMFLIAQLLLGQSQSIDMVTDRPDITESAVTVPLHFVQIETGYQHNKDGFKLINHIGSTLLRYGLSSNIELRFAGEYQLLNKELGTILFHTEDGFNNSFENQIKGLAGTMAGAKIQFINEKNSGFNFAVLMQLFLPLGKTGLVPDKVEPEMILSFDKSITDGLSVGLNVGGIGIVVLTKQLFFIHLVLESLFLIL